MKNPSVAAFLCVAFVLGACQRRVTVRSWAQVDGEVMLDDGSFAAVTADDSEPDLWLYDDPDRDAHLDLLVPRPGAGGVVVGLTAPLIAGPCGGGCDLGLRLCVCHPRGESQRWGYCAHNDERNCVELEATMVGTYAREECDGSECLRQLDASFHIPEGGELVGEVRVVHEEEWQLEGGHAE